MGSSENIRPNKEILMPASEFAPAVALTEIIDKLSMLALRYVYKS